MVTITGEQVPSRNAAAEAKRAKAMLQSAVVGHGMQLNSQDALGMAAHSALQSRQHHSATIYLCVALTFLVASLLVFYFV